MKYFTNTTRYKHIATIYGFTLVTRLREFPDEYLCHWIILIQNGAKNYGLEGVGDVRGLKSGYYKNVNKNRKTYLGQKQKQTKHIHMFFVFTQNKNFIHFNSHLIWTSLISMHLSIFTTYTDINIDPHICQLYHHLCIKQQMLSFLFQHWLCFCNLYLQDRSIVILFPTTRSTRTLISYQVNSLHRFLNLSYLFYKTYKYTSNV